MALQTINSPHNSQSSLSFPGYNLQKSTDGSKNLANNNSSRSTLNAAVTTESYYSEKYAMEFTSEDGDKVSFSYESVQYSSSTMNIEAEGSDEEVKNLNNFVKNELRKMAHEIVKDFLKNSGVDVEESGDTENVSSDFQVPEYWNAENTSQRIVDFAVSFFDSFQGAGEEFLTKIKDAIESGFEQAKNFFGDTELPDGVSKLVSDTHDLIMQKLDSWAAEKGIGVTTTDATESAA